MVYLVSKFSRIYFPTMSTEISSEDKSVDWPGVGGMPMSPYDVFTKDPNARVHSSINIFFCLRGVNVL